MDLRSKDAIESSKQHDIDMSNILIAEFMGHHTYESNGYIMISYSDCNERTLQDTHYHTSWDWLMLVVQKCRQENQLEYFDRVYYALEECDINVTYKAVVEFIKNQNN